MDAMLTMPTATPETDAPTVTLACLTCGANEEVPPDELVARLAAHEHGAQGETPAPTVEELLATPARFRAWLERMRRGYGPDFIIGKACETFWCPLNQFLADELGRDHFAIEVELCPPEVQLLRIDDGEATVEKEGPAITPPWWAQLFVRQVDLYPSGRVVRVDEALFILDYVEEAIA